MIMYYYVQVTHIAFTADYIGVQARKPRTIASTCRDKRELDAFDYFVVTAEDNRTLLANLALYKRLELRHHESGATPASSTSRIDLQTGETRAHTKLYTTDLGA